VKLAKEPLEQFNAGIAKLLVEWPEHPVLMVMAKICDRILNFPITAPLMQVLIGFELLLKKGYEWQANASKAVSLHEHLDVISSLVLRWRRIELESWPQILESRAQKFEISASTVSESRLI
jgi:midasin